MNDYIPSDPFEDRQYPYTSGTVSYASSSSSYHHPSTVQGQGDVLGFTTDLAAAQNQPQYQYPNGQGGGVSAGQGQGQEQAAQGSGGGQGSGGNMDDLSWSMGDGTFLPQQTQGTEQVTLSMQGGGGASQFVHSMQQPSMAQQPHAQLLASPSATTAGTTSSVDRNNTFLTLLAGMPNATDDPASHAMWMQAVQYKVKSLELDIAEARRKEREAELELARLKAVVDRRTSFRHADPQASTPQRSMGPLPVAQNAMLGQSAGRMQAPGSGHGQGSGSGSNLQLNVPPVSEQTYVPTSTTRSHSFTTATYPYLHTRPMLGPAVSPQNQKPSVLPEVGATQTLSPSNNMQTSASATEASQTHQMMLDLDALMAGGSGNIDNMFSWMPDFTSFGQMNNGAGAGGMNAMSAGMAQGIDPNTLRFASTNPMDAFNGSAIELESDYMPTPIIKSEPDHADQEPLPSKRKGSSGAESVGVDDLPPIKRTRKGIEKKITVDLAPRCISCGKAMARVMVRALRAQLPDRVEATFTCLECKHVKITTDATVSSTAIGTVETRKRMRVTMDIEDDASSKKERRQFCDVCQRLIGSGWIRGGREKDKRSVQGMAEIVCSSCDARYQRCTDCGGGGGSRLNVGKWRLKEVFPPGRKTCSLSHSRLGDRQRDIGVHVTPSDFDQQELREVLARCKELWREKNLSRLAVPEMMEMDLPPNLINPLHSYADINKIIVDNWPAREAMIKAQGADTLRYKRILGLTWAHTKPRRPVRTVDIEEEHSRAAEQDAGEGDKSTVLDNVRMTDQVIPAGCELIGMWGGEWDMQHGSILISTFIPFEGTDGEDSAALSVGEIISKVQTLQAEMNENIKAAAAAGQAVEPIPACEHLWVVSGSTVPLVRERMADILTRKRSFVHLDEYLTRHPDFANAVRDRPYGLHPSSLALPNQPLSSPASSVPSSPGTGTSNTRPLILARWLGNDFGPDKIREIKEMEFGGKQKMRKKGKKAAAV